MDKSKASVFYPTVTNLFASHISPIYTAKMKDNNHKWKEWKEKTEEEEEEAFEAVWISISNNWTCWAGNVCP